MIEEQKAYYQARAVEYDQWFLRQGRYDRGEESNRHWLSEVALLKDALTGFHPAGDVLEIAAGTGWWTRELLPHAARLTALDASSEALRLNRSRLDQDPRVEYLQADIFDWIPSRTYDVVFFSFWLSHVPAERFDSFWERVSLALRPEGRVFFIDSLRSEMSIARDQQLPEAETPISIRKLNDGREFRIVKIFYDPGELRRRLESLGWCATVEQTAHYFLYGTARRA